MTAAGTTLPPLRSLERGVEPAWTAESGPTGGEVRWAVVVPTLGRPSLDITLRSLADQHHLPDEIVVVDDRPDGGPDLDVDLPVLDVNEPQREQCPHVQVRRGHGRGPAHARNVGWQACRSPWVVFVDDDVVLPPAWSEQLLTELAAADDEVGGVQARIEVPLPADRRPTDWERGTAGLTGAVWATAEMAYRREALVEVGGFDERFPRAYREDADLAMRVRAGFRLVRGEHRVTHPVRPSDTWGSLRQQRGNRDDALMRRLHGRTWRSDAGCPPGRLPWHAATSAAGVTSLLAAAAGRRSAATLAAAVWSALTFDFAVRRVAPGPLTVREVATMLVTSAAIPPYAVTQRLLGTVEHRRARPWRAPVRAVLFDRDGTLVEDVPYNSDPGRVRLVDDAAGAVQRLREAGIKVGVVTNQSGIARGLMTREQADSVNTRIEQLLGPFDTWQLCPHGPDDGCACRKPLPGMVSAACEQLGVAPQETVVVGDIGADLQAARAAGARGVLVPNDRTLPDEVRAARHVAPTLTAAVDLLLAGVS